MKLSIVAAIGNNNVIGKDNNLIWHLPADLKYFKTLTMGHTMIMGRKTFESIGKALPGRKTIILSSSHTFYAEGCQVARSMAEALEMAAKDKEVFVVGGSEVYAQALQLSKTRYMYLTRVYASFDGDAFFPDFDDSQWELISMEDHQPDEKNPYAYSFLKYKRKARC